MKKGAENFKKSYEKSTKRLSESHRDKALRIELMLPQPKEFVIKSTEKVEKKVHSSKEIKAIVTAGLKRAVERKIEYAIMREESFKRRAENKAKRLAKKAT